MTLNAYEWRNRTGAARSARIPLGIKLAYTGFMAVLVPVYLHYYGPTNFLYFCDIALLLTLVAIWPENALLISMCCVGIIVPQAVWVFDFLASSAGFSLTGMTDYMFDPSHSLFLRFLSLFHGWLPFLLLYLVWRVGYDRRALASWTAVTWVVLPICFFLMPAPTADPGLTPVNINYVWGMRDTIAQHWVPAYVWFLGLLIGLPLLIFAPAHFILSRAMPKAETNPPTATEPR